jgi:hypothetical protein
LRKRRKRTGAVREEPIEGIDREAHEFGLTLTPALVAPQYPQRSGILARIARREHKLRERSCIEEA